MINFIRMKKGDVAKVFNTDSPAGLVPSYNARLIYQYGKNGKWYAVKTDEKEFVSTLDKSKIFLLEPENTDTV